ncbi:MAG: hypothetical protein JW791_02305 [Nanoarchaeota archaeon]|nr:hypothetical protein [Nanoarchaeota archaeon]
MRTRLQKQSSRSMSGRKAQLMSIDSSISYLLFALFLLYMSNYIVNISKPFTSYINYGELYKNSESLSNDFVTSDVSREYLNNICTTDYVNVVSTRANYEVEAVKLPGFDEETNPSIQGVHMRREGSKVTLFFNTGLETNFDLIIVTNEKVSFNNYNTEAGDEFNITRSSSVVTINVHSDNTLSDTDDYELETTGDALIFFNYYENSFENVYLGTTPLSYSCGALRSLSKKSYFSSYAVLEEKEVIVAYGVDVWWD